LNLSRERWVSLRPGWGDMRLSNQGRDGAISDLGRVGWGLTEIAKDIIL